eukprot:SAG22_NODE_2_length_61565_cov_858.782010_30_plen_69_part_00
MQSMVLKSQISLKESLLNSFSPNKFPSSSKQRSYVFIERSHISQLYFVHTGLELETVSFEEAQLFLNF